MQHRQPLLGARRTTTRGWPFPTTPGLSSHHRAANQCGGRVVQGQSSASDAAGHKILGLPESSGYPSRRYQKEPWKLLAPLTLYGRRARKMYSPYRRAGPVNWTPRFDAMFLDGAGFRSFCAIWRTIRCGRIWRGRRRIGRGRARGRIARVRMPPGCSAWTCGVICLAIRRWRRRLGRRFWRVRWRKSGGMRGGGRCRLTGWRGRWRWWR